MLIIINCIHTRKEDQAVTNVLDNFIRSYYTDFAAFVKDDARRSRKIQSAPKTYAPTKRQEIKKHSEISWLSDPSPNPNNCWGRSNYNPAYDKPYDEWHANDKLIFYNYL